MPDFRWSSWFIGCAAVNSPVAADAPRKHTLRGGFLPNLGHSAGTPHSGLIRGSSDRQQRGGEGEAVGGYFFQRFRWISGPEAGTVGSTKAIESKASRSSRRVPEVLEPRLLLAADLLISEFMADNETTLQDEDGDASDWIEVFNRGSTAIDLEGWHLTDNADRLTQWEFPAVQLPAGRSLVVFASGKDRDRVDRELHTNFRLSAGGEYSGAVAPDGVTIVDQYAPFPEQYGDVSFGPEQTVISTHYLDPDSISRLWLPTSNATDIAAAEWTQVNFDDLSWPTVPTAIGYDVNAADGDFQPLIGEGGDTIAMRGQTASAYLRSEFPFDEDGPTLESLDFAVNFNDGFVAYLNGVEVARHNAPTELSWDSVANGPHGGISDQVQMIDFSDPDDRDAFTLVGNATWVDERLQLTPAAENRSGARHGSRTP